jgi:ribonuclease P protein component
LNSAPATTSEPPRERLRFPRAARLRFAAEFRRVKDHGRSFGGRFIVLGVLREADPGRDCRIGLVTSRRVGGAVARNRVRRRLREAIRASRSRLRAGGWLVVIARHLAARATAAELREEWLRLADRASMLLPSADAPAPGSTP